jgi:hypothetical protein
VFRLHINIPGKANFYQRSCNYYLLHLSFTNRHPITHLMYLICQYILYETSKSLFRALKCNGKRYWLRCRNAEVKVVAFPAYGLQRQCNAPLPTPTCARPKRMTASGRSKLRANAMWGIDAYNRREFAKRRRDSVVGIIIGRLKAAEASGRKRV